MVIEDIKTDASVAVDVGVVDFCSEVDLTIRESGKLKLVFRQKSLQKAQPRTKKGSNRYLWGLERV